jgi:SAM-dependent methyltransferase
MDENDLEPAVEDATAFWEKLYTERDQIWSGRPNHSLVTIVADIAPGHALDLGCGEGGDAVWLAGRGWRVTAVDIAGTAIGRAAALAERSGVPEDRIDWRVEDLSSWRPPGRYDLVSACFFHSPQEFPRTEVLRRAASAITPNGYLLLVGHGAFPPWSQNHDHGDHRFLTPAEEIAELQLDPERWATITSEIRRRPATGPDGEQATLDDSVVLLRRID